MEWYHLFIIVVVLAIILYIQLRATNRYTAGYCDDESVVDNKTWIDAKQTAKNNYNVDIQPLCYVQYTVDEFDNLRAENHRAVKNKSLEEIFPPNDRPRGEADIKSVKYHMSHKSHPIVLLKNDNIPPGYIVLDGVHRIVAAYLTNSNILALIVVKK